MYRTYIVAVILVLTAFGFVAAPLLMLGCSGTQTQQQARVASGVAIVANTGLDILGKVYETQLTDAVLAAAQAKYDGVDQRSAAIDQAELAVVDRWRAVWGDPPGAPESRVGLWTLFRAAHAAWAEAIERGETGDSLLEQLTGAYCALTGALPVDAARLIRIDAIQCGGDAGAGGPAPDGARAGALPLRSLMGFQVDTIAAANVARSKAGARVIAAMSKSMTEEASR